MSEPTTAISNGAAPSPNKVTIRYRFGIAPDHKIETDPSLMETVRAMDKIDGAVFLGTVLVPSFYGYHLEKSFSGPLFKFGLMTGLFAGAVYAYSRSYTRLTGIFIPTPKYKAEAE